MLQHFLPFGNNIIFFNCFTLHQNLASEMKQGHIQYPQNPNRALPPLLYLTRRVNLLAAFSAVHDSACTATYSKSRIAHKKILQVPSSTGAEGLCRTQSPLCRPSATSFIPITAGPYLSYGPGVGIKHR